MSPLFIATGTAGDIDIEFVRPTDGTPHQDRLRVPPGTASTGPRVLVVMLYSGEPQVDRALSALARQEGVQLQVVLLSGFKNREGHDRLYQIFMESADEFDYFLKLDSDMVIVHASGLATAIVRMQSEPADHLVLPLFDWLSDRPLHGAHLFRSHLVWELGSSEALFVDRNPVNSQRKVVISLSDAAFAVHNPEPAEADAYSFGVHRGRKAIQRGVGPGTYRCQQARDQMQLLRAIRDVSRVKPDRRRWHALIGAADALRNTVSETEYRSASLGSRLERLQALDDRELSMIAIAWWFSPWRSIQFELQAFVRCAAAFVRRVRVRVGRAVGCRDQRQVREFNR